MASTVWNTICEIFSNLVRPTRRKTRVTFTPSTLQRHIMRETRLAATTNPFLNFFAEVRIKAMQDSKRPIHVTRLATTSGHLWKEMSDEQKRPYRELAIEQKLKKTRRKRRRRSASYTPITKLRKRRRKLREIMLAKAREAGGGDG
ncbi:uncharacterized protein [Musca autumnalis]|uniref:uncharacterized protein n=1 Tax=Musca autumnalis TaxID=221902 RepID=UPI003CE9B8B6